MGMGDGGWNEAQQTRTGDDRGVHLPVKETCGQFDKGMYLFDLGHDHTQKKWKIQNTLRADDDDHTPYSVLHETCIINPGTWSNTDQKARKAKGGCRVPWCKRQASGCCWFLAHSHDRHATALNFVKSQDKSGHAQTINSGLWLLRRRVWFNSW